MATITEDYVSFETAKLLKEKGFDGFCERFYDYYPETGEVNICGCDEHNNSRYDDEFSMPTQQMAMKWLREVHNIMVSPYALSLGYYFEIFDLTNRDITGCKPLYKVGIPNKEDISPTYELSCEEAIKYSLKNLI